jgi:hypothetical protein
MDNEVPLFNRVVRGRLGLFGIWTTMYKGPMKLKVYPDRVVASVLFFKKTIPISTVKQLTWASFGWMQIENSSGGILKFVSFRVLGKNDPQIRELSIALKKAGVVWKEIGDLDTGEGK